jgi:hypothetical protein
LPSFVEQETKVGDSHSEENPRSNLENDLRDLDDKEPDVQANVVAREKNSFKRSGGLFLASLVMFVVLAVWQTQFETIPSNASFRCIKNALYFDSIRSGCTDTLVGLVTTVESQATLEENLVNAHTPEWAFEERGWPRIYIWMDNLLIDTYTLLFIVIVGRSYARITIETSRRKRSCWTMAFGITLVSCIFGALADHSENFWLLAHIGTSHLTFTPGLNFVSGLSAWKIRFFVLNCLLSLLWVLACRRQQFRSVVGGAWWSDLKMRASRCERRSGSA